MTNEELAVCIQNGDESKVPELWERMHKLYAAKSLSYYGAHKALCDRCGVELDDIQQQSFFAFLRSVEEFQPESGLLFTSFVNFPFKTEMQNLTGTRTAAARNDPLNHCASLDKELENEDGSGDTLGDFVPDPTALDFVELLDAESVGEMVRAEVRRLPRRSEHRAGHLQEDSGTDSDTLDTNRDTFAAISTDSPAGSATNATETACFATAATA